MQNLPRAIHIPLSGDIADALYQLSQKQFRHPRQQAALLIVEGLQRAGALSQQPDPDRQGVADAASR